MFTDDNTLSKGQVSEWSKELDLESIHQQAPVLQDAWVQTPS